MPFDTPIHTNQHSIQRVLNAGLPVIVVFWKTQCAPCQQLDPILARLARDYAGKLLVAKVDAESEKALLDRYNITALPGLLFVKDGRVAAQTAGAVAEAGLRAWADYLTRARARPELPTGPSISLRPTRPTSPPPRPASGGASSAHRAVSHPVHLTDATFEQAVMHASTPVLVDFWAQWCRPCHMIAPAVEALAQEFAGKLLVAKLNVDENPRTASRFRVMSIPTLLVFKNGRVVDQIVGAMPAPALRQRVMQHLG